VRKKCVNPSRPGTGPLPASARRIAFVAALGLALLVPGAAAAEPEPFYEWQFSEWREVEPARGGLRPPWRLPFSGLE
jgi:hypothetical protein